jgi:acyl-CoA thioester hydrolase
MDVRIYYEDTDSGGVVYHANYIKYWKAERSIFVVTAFCSWLDKQDLCFGSAIRVGAKPRTS